MDETAVIVHVRQDRFNTEFLGGDVQSVTKKQLISRLKEHIRTREYATVITAAHMNVLRIVKSLRGTHFFDVRC